MSDTGPNLYAAPRTPHGSGTLHKNMKIQTEASAICLAWPSVGDQGGKPLNILRASPSGYSDYTKGHQIPSADRLGSRAMNNSVFYMTNITPQASKFNGGVWGSLEQKVRTWADASDEFYVVTGCLISDSGGTVTSNGLNIAVPTHYYKALLRKKGDTYTACGYFYEHFGTQTSFSASDRISIDGLEAATGVDFFPNLIGIIGENEAARVESTAAAF